MMAIAVMLRPRKLTSELIRRLSLGDRHGLGTGAEGGERFAIGD